MALYFIHVRKTVEHCYFSLFVGNHYSTAKKKKCPPDLMLQMLAELTILEIFLLPDLKSLDLIWPVIVC